MKPAEVKGLWGLYGTVSCTLDGFAHSFFSEETQAVGHGTSRQGCATRLCDLEGAANERTRDQGAHSIVNSYQSLLRELTQPRAYRLKARRSAIGDVVGEGELMLGAELLPQSLLVGWQDEDEFLNLRGELTQRVHQDRLSSEGKELLRQLRPHT